MVLEALRDVNAEGDIRGSSDRYLRQAAQAAIGAARGGLVEGAAHAVAHVADADANRGGDP
jgi:hypothetical protein